MGAPASMHTSVPPLGPEVIVSDEWSETFTIFDGCLLVLRIVNLSCSA